MSSLHEYRLELVFPEHDFILAIEKNGDYPLNQWLADNQHFVTQAIHKHGGVLFRGFGLSPDEFVGASAIVSPHPPLPYTAGMSPRPKYSDSLYVSTQRPKELEIPLHHEYSYFPFWPMKIFFYCETAPLRGGETSLASTRSFMSRLNPRILTAIAARRVRYVRNYAPEFRLSWQQAFESDDRAVVERFCRTNDIQFEWRENGQLRTTNISQGTALHPQTGESLWHNHIQIFSMYQDPQGRLSPVLAQYAKSVSPEVMRRVLSLPAEEMPTNAFYGDGAEIEPAVIEEVFATLERVKVGFPWVKGDFLALDNMLTFHGRSSFEGPRLILTLLKEQHRTQPAVLPGST